LRVSENRVLRRVFGPKEEEVTVDRQNYLVRFQVLTAASMKMAVIWVVAPCIIRAMSRPDDGDSRHL
jgi:hypothetical protein